MSVCITSLIFRNSKKIRLHDHCHGNSEPMWPERILQRTTLTDWEAARIYGMYTLGNKLIDIPGRKELGSMTVILLFKTVHTTRNSTSGIFHFYLTFDYSFSWNSISERMERGGERGKEREREKKRVIDRER